MNVITRLKNKLIAKMITRFPKLADSFIEKFSPLNFTDSPWTEFSKNIKNCKIAVVTTSGVHHKDQQTFNMKDQNGDPSFRVIDLEKDLSSLMITHDYFDHSDADKDINIIFPVQRLKEFEKEGIIGELARWNYSFMGHIVGPYIHILIANARNVANKLKENEVDAVFLTPG